jgi:flagella basal body P-ring formation protein FlgA
MANRSIIYRFYRRRSLAVSALTALIAWRSAAAADVQSLTSIRDSVERYIRADFQALGKISAVEVAQLDPRLQLAACEQPLSPFIPNGQRRLGNVTIGIRCDGARPWTLYVPVRIVSSVNIMTAARSLPRGSILTSQDIVVVERDPSTLPYGFFTDAAELLGQQLKRGIRPGEAFSPAMVAPPPLVERGQIVWIATEAGSLKVSMQGEALTAGAAGQRIRVRNLSSKRVLEAEVVSANLVRIDL